VPFPFIAARNFTKGRDAPIDVLVVHAMEAAERPDTAEAVARWFAGPHAPRASAHFCIDADSIVRCVRDDDVAWHAPGANHNGLGFEHAGYSAQTDADWDDSYSHAMLSRSARLVAAKCREYGIPPVWLFPADLLAGRRGITSHWNVTRAFRRSDHTDPGAAFPVERYVGLVRRALTGTGPGKGPRPIATRQLAEEPPTLRLGDEGWRVRRLQRLLAARALDLAIDGKFGPETLRAVLELQRREGLPADGIVGPLTWRALLAGGERAGASPR
jgi:N-acetylmuramoyl-L-alanine amidase/Putative peptidoglycan binding domain